MIQTLSDSSHEAQGTERSSHVVRKTSGNIYKTASTCGYLTYRDRLHKVLIWSQIRRQGAYVSATSVPPHDALERRLLSGASCDEETKGNVSYIRAPKALTIPYDNPEITLVKEMYCQ